MVGAVRGTWVELCPARLEACSGAVSAFFVSCAFSSESAEIVSMHIPLMLMGITQHHPFVIFAQSGKSHPPRGFPLSLGHKARRMGQPMIPTW